MSNQPTLHHKFKIDSGRTKFKQRKTDRILYNRESHEKVSQGSAGPWFDQTTSCIVQAKVGKTSRHELAQREGLKFCQTRCIAIILYDTLPARCIRQQLR